MSCAQLGDASAVVLITQANNCPVSRNTSAAVKALQDQYSAKGVEIFMLNSTPSDKREAIVAEAQAYGYNLPILMDTNQLVGEQLGVTRTAEAIVIDPKTWKIVYRGPIDDKVTYERQKAAADHTWAKDALDSMLAGKPVAVARVEAVGCLVDFPERAKMATSKVTYVKNIAPMFEDKCVSCHEPGGIGPMPFTKFEEIAPFAPMIREMIRTQRMPPWRADPSVGHFLGDRSLSAAQIKTLVHWVEDGAPRGTGADPLAAKTFTAPEWPLGKPDLVLDVPAYTIPANGIVDYQRPYVVNPLKEGKWLRASTIKVVNRQTVHHILTGYLAEVPGPGQVANESKWGTSLGGYAVGAESFVEPADTGAYHAAGRRRRLPGSLHAVRSASHRALANRAVLLQGQTEVRDAQLGRVEREHRDSGEQGEHRAAGVHRCSQGHAAVRRVPARPLPRRVLAVLSDRAGRQEDPAGLPAALRLQLAARVQFRSAGQGSGRIETAGRLHLRQLREKSGESGSQSRRALGRSVLRRNALHRIPLRVGRRDLGQDGSVHAAYDKALNDNRLFGMLDTKMNGKLDMSELTGPIGKDFAASFAKIDTDHDGFIEPNELAAAQANVQKRRQQASQPGPAGAAARRRNRHRRRPEAVSNTLVAARVVYL